jgi:hypothetical protein
MTSRAGEEAKKGIIGGKPVNASCVYSCRWLDSILAAPSGRALFAGAHGAPACLRH